MVTLKEVAKEAGLSVGTVSQMLHTSDSRYSAATRERVEGVARRLGYRPNHLARSMVRGRTQCVGVVGHMLNNMLGMARLDAIGGELQKLGYQMFLAGRKVDVAFAEEKTLIEDLISRRVDGLLIGAEPYVDSSYYEQLVRRKVPFVLLAHVDPSKRLPSVQVATDEGMSAIIHHLFELGHRDIAFALGSYSASLPHHGRMLGIEHAYDTLGLRLDPRRVLADRLITHQSSQDFTREQMSQVPRPTAVVYSNDEMALAGMRALREMGLEIPRDVSVVGFDDLPLASLISPTLTTVRQPREEYGEIAVRSLLDQIRQGTPGKGSRIVLQPSLVARESTGPVRRN